MSLRTPFVLALAAPVLLAGCTSNALSAGEQGFVGTTDGQVTVITDETARKAPDGEISGESLDGDPISLDDFAGKVVVMPVWGSWCAPCRVEAPMLAEAARDLKNDGVEFLGIDSRDPNVAAAKAFVDRFDIDYPSIYDPDGVSLLAFHGTLPALTIPSFVFIDAEGRVAGRALGKIDTSTLYGVVEDILGTELTPAATPTPQVSQ